MDVSKVQHPGMSPAEQAPESRLMEQPMWDVVMEPEQDSPSIPSEEEVENVRPDGAEGDECPPSGPTSVGDKPADELQQGLNGSVPPSFQVQEQRNLFDPQLSGCEIPDQRTALEGSQVGQQTLLPVGLQGPNLCKQNLLDPAVGATTGSCVPVNYHHGSELRGPGVRRHPAQRGRRRRGGGHLHRHRGRLRPGLRVRPQNASDGR